MKSKPKLLFVDDDQTEIDELRPMVEAAFLFEGRAWPFSRPLRTVVGEQPRIFVLDLYLPPKRERVRPRLSGGWIARQRALAESIARGFSRLYPVCGPADGKKLLRQTMECLTNGRKLLDNQWKALGQSPRNGIALMRELRRRYPDTPIVFYSRKITPADVVEVLKKGAFDAIQKGSLSARELRKRLKSDLALFEDEGVNATIPTGTRDVTRMTIRGR